MSSRGVIAEREDDEGRVFLDTSVVADLSTDEGEMMDIYRELEPLYKQLHAFVRRKLYDVYGGVILRV